MLPPLGTTGRASIFDVTGWGGGCWALRAAGGGDLLLVQRGREAPRGGAAEFVYGFFLFVVVTQAILTYPNKVLRKIQYIYVVLVYGASMPALIYPLASLS